MSASLSNFRFVIWIWLCQGVWTETLVNPPSERTYHCGIHENCTITCDRLYSCGDVTFYLYNHHADLQFSGQTAGMWAKIINKNATSITLTATGESSLWMAEVIVDYPSTKLYTKCDGYQACRWAAFYYRTEETVTHICAGGSGCERATIHAITSIDLQCHNEQDACGKLDVIWPTDPMYIRPSKMVHYVNNVEITRSPRYLYLANTDMEPNITCLEGCSTFEISIVYGSTFDQICSFNDATCIPNLLAYEDPYNVTAFNNDFYPSYRNGDYTYSQNTILSIHRYDSSWFGSTDFNHSNLPTTINFISNNDAFISILCTECNEVTLNFSTISNTVITVMDFALYLVIDGPKNSITTSIVYNSAAGVMNARYLLQNTPNVWFNGLPELNGDECDDPARLCTSDIYLANQTNVTIKGFLQRENDCCRDNEKVNIFSNVGPESNAKNHGWDIRCGTDINNCVFFRFYPTLAPTSSPTLPTIDPTFAPTFSPTSITIDPTAVPTGNTVSPTVSTTDPTPAPSIDPTLFPSFAPSFPPSSASSSAPTQPPTKAPWSEAEVIEPVTTIISDDDGRRGRLVVEKNTALYTAIWILVGLLVVGLAALAVYLFKKKRGRDTHKDHMDMELEVVQPGATTGGTDKIEPPILDHIPSLPAEGRRSTEQAVMLDDSEDDSSDTHHSLYDNATETTKGEALDGTTKGDTLPTGNGTDGEYIK